LVTGDVVEHGRQGLLTANDRQALAQAIGQLLDNLARLAEYSQAARSQDDWP
jgi:hypothetical protein